MSLPWPNLTTAEWERLLAGEDVALAEWDESLHPREADGKFTTAGGGETATATKSEQPARAHVSDRVDMAALTVGMSPARARAMRDAVAAVTADSFDDLPSMAQANESMLFVTENGKTIGLENGPNVIHGDNNGINLPDELRAPMKAAAPLSITVLHTHPQYSPFSSADLHMALAFNQHMVVVAQDGRSYRCDLKREPTDDERLVLPGELAQAFYPVRETAMRRTDADVKARGWSTHPRGQRAAIAAEHPEVNDMIHRHFAEESTKQWKKFAKAHDDLLSFHVIPAKGQS